MELFIALAISFSGLLVGYSFGEYHNREINSGQLFFRCLPFLIICSICLYIF